MNLTDRRDGHARPRPHEEPNGAVQLRTVLVFLEGRHDIEFLRRLSRILSREQLIPSDLDMLAANGHLIFVPMGGIHVDWTDRFSNLGCEQFFLVDREYEPETSQRRLLIERINSRPLCHGSMTSKRSLECFLHPAAIEAAGGPHIQFSDDDSVADVLVRNWLAAGPICTLWSELPRRTQQRFANRAKRWLCRMAVEKMTPALLAERDPPGEVIEWLTTIIEMTERVQR